MNSFSELGIKSFFNKKLDERLIEKPTAIQKLVIPELLAGKNIFFRSETGTGKTFAYLLPFLQKLTEEADIDSKREAKPAVHTTSLKGEVSREREKFINSPALLIIAPTLELCSQISGELEFLINETEIRHVLAIGSANLDRQIETIKKIKPQIIIGNPVRLLVLAKKKIFKFNNLRFLVLDEADRLVSDEMSDDTNELAAIIAKNTKNKALVITACSATLNKKCIEKIKATVTGNAKETDTGLNNINKRTIQFIESDEHEILREKIEHWAIFSEKRKKDQTLRSLLSALKTKKGKKSKVKALVFTSRGEEAALILSRLQYHHVPAAGLFGKINKKSLSGQERKAALDSFRQGGAEVLVCTDLAARGLDINGVTHIIALDVPSDREVYIHRCGRTARAGKYGTMITIGDETQMRLLASLEKKLKIRIQPKELYNGQICVPLQDEENLN